MARKNGIRERGTGSIEKKRNHFYLKLRIGDTTKRTLLLGPDDQPVTTRKDAEKAADLLRPVLRATQKEEIAFHVANARKLVKNSILPVEKIWETYLKQSSRPDSGEVTLRGYQYLLSLFLRWLRKEHPEISAVNQISKEIAISYFNYIWNDNISPSSYNKRKHALHLVFHHIKEIAGIEENPFDHVVRKACSESTRDAFTEEQVQQIFGGFKTGFFYNTTVVRLGKGRKHERVERRLEFKPLHKEEMYVLLNLCCWTGCRGEDGCLMQWDSIDWKHGTISFVPLKTAKKTGYKSVALPLHPQLSEALKQALEWRKDNKQGEDYIIPHVAARYLYNHSGVQKDVMKIIRCATGLETTAEVKGQHRKVRANKYSLHSFRHTFVSFCANAGVSLDIVAAIVGHSSTAMTQHYTHISDEAKSKAIQALPVLTEPKKDTKEELLQKLSELSEEDLKKLLNGTKEVSTESGISEEKQEPQQENLQTPSIDSEDDLYVQPPLFDAM